jgi:hypothetical protein
MSANPNLAAALAATAASSRSARSRLAAFAAVDWRASPARAFFLLRCSGNGLPRAAAAASLARSPARALARPAALPSRTAGARAFISYALSPAGQKVLAKYGLEPPGG